MDNALVGPSGPGVFSKRTDVETPEMKLGSIAYGEGKETAAIKAGAPLAKTGNVTPSQAPNVPQNQIPLTGLYAKTQLPDQPISAGIDVGPGPGSNALGMTQITTKLSDSLAALLPFDNTGEVAVLYQEALAQGN
jgi:hypothetical protein